MGINPVFHDFTSSYLYVPALLDSILLSFSQQTTILNQSLSLRLKILLIMQRANVHLFGLFAHVRLCLRYRCIREQSYAHYLIMGLTLYINAKIPHRELFTFSRCGCAIAFYRNSSTVLSPVFPPINSTPAS